MGLGYVLRSCAANHSGNKSGYLTIGCTYLSVCDLILFVVVYGFVFCLSFHFFCLFSLSFVYFRAHKLPSKQATRQATK